MRTIAVEELGKAGELIARGERTLVSQGDHIVAILQPFSESGLSPEERSRRYLDAVEPIAQRLDELGVTEEDVQRDFDAFKANRRGR